MGLKYVHVVNKITPAMKNCLEEVPRRGGMYNWMFLFKGTMIPFNLATKEKLEEFDVVQVNMAPVDQLIVREVYKKLKGSSTILIGNNDYVCEAWDTWSQHPLQYAQAQEYPDAIFGTEEHQVSHLRDDAYTIPHPHWIKMLKHIGNDDLDEDKMEVGCMYHWWEGKTYTQSLLFQKLRETYPNLYSKLYGYGNTMHDKLKGWQRVMWDEISPLMDYPDFLRSLQTNKLFLENCSYHTYGRTTVDTAALGVPSIGTDRVFSMKHCFPEMSCDPFDLKQLQYIANRVLKRGSWLDEQMDYAYEAVEYFNYKNSKKRYMNMYDETKESVGK